MTRGRPILVFAIVLLAVTARAGAAGRGTVAPGVARPNVLFMDGSVRSLATSIDFTTYVSLVGIGEGAVITLD